MTERGRQPSANRMETLGRRDRVKYAEGAGGLVDTTPGPVTSTQSSCELQPRRQADGSVVATPSPAAPASANCGLVSKLVPLARYGSIRLARPPGLHAHPGCRGPPGLPRAATAFRSTSAGLFGMAQHQAWRAVHLRWHRYSRLKRCSSSPPFQSLPA